MIEPTRPQNITIDRSASVMQVTWLDKHQSRYELRWLRANCPCATCREERREAALNTDPLKLVSGPPPSTEIAGRRIRRPLRDALHLGRRPRDGHLRLLCPPCQLPVPSLQPGRAAAALA